MYEVSVVGTSHSNVLIAYSRAAVSCQMEVLKSFEILDRLQNEIDTAFIEECAASCSFIFLSPQYMDFSSFSLCSFPLLSHFEESHLILIIPNYIYFILNIYVEAAQMSISR